MSSGTRLREMQKEHLTPAEQRSAGVGVDEASASGGSQDDVSRRVSLFSLGVQSQGGGDKVCHSAPPPRRAARARGTAPQARRRYRPAARQRQDSAGSQLMGEQEPLPDEIEIEGVELLHRGLKVRARRRGDGAGCCRTGPLPALCLLGTFRAARARAAHGWRQAPRRCVGAGPDASLSGAGRARQPVQGLPQVGAGTCRTPLASVRWGRALPSIEQVQGRRVDATCPSHRWRTWWRTRATFCYSPTSLSCSRRWSRCSTCAALGCVRAATCRWRERDGRRMHARIGGHNGHIPPAGRRVAAGAGVRQAAQEVCGAEGEGGGEASEGE